MDRTTTAHSPPPPRSRPIPHIRHPTYKYLSPCLFKSKSFITWGLHYIICRIYGKRETKQIVSQECNGARWVQHCGDANAVLCPASRCLVWDAWEGRGLLNTIRELQNTITFGLCLPQEAGEVCCTGKFKTRENFFRYCRPTHHLPPFQYLYVYVYIYLGETCRRSEKQQNNTSFRQRRKKMKRTEKMGVAEWTVASFTVCYTNRSNHVDKARKRSLG